MSPEKNVREELLQIFIIEDNRDLRELVRDMLEQEGYQVWTADNGQEALETLVNKHVHPDVILLDFDMPIMDGAAFRSAQLQFKELASIPTILMTSPENPSLHRINTDGFIAKPFTMSRVFDEIDRVLNKPQSEIPPSAPSILLPS